VTTSVQPYAYILHICTQAQTETLRLGNVPFYSKSWPLATCLCCHLRHVYQNMLRDPIKPSQSSLACQEGHGANRVIWPTQQHRLSSHRRLLPPFP